MLFRFFYTVLFLLSFFKNVQGQKFHFVHYGVEDGLAQSQVSGISQDSSHYLWIATLGGISRFDGTHFVNYTTAHGLMSNFTSFIYIDRSQKVWVGSQLGITRFDGKNFRNFRLHVNGPTAIVSSVVEDESGGIYVLYGSRLYFIRQEQCQRVSRPGEVITALGKTAGGEILVAVNGAIYKKKTAGFALCDGQGNSLEDAVAEKIVTRKKGGAWVITKKGLFVFQDNRIIKDSASCSLDWKDVISMGEENGHHLWLGTTKGVRRLTSFTGPIRSFHFTARNGFTDQAVTQVFQDAEGNMWYASNSDGLFSLFRRSIQLFR